MRSHDVAHRPGVAKLLHCPRCGLSVAPRVHWLAIKHCPRCLARRHLAVELVPREPPAREPARSAFG